MLVVVCLLKNKILQTWVLAPRWYHTRDPKEGVFLYLTGVWQLVADAVDDLLAVRTLQRVATSGARHRGLGSQETPRYKASGAIVTTSSFLQLLFSENDGDLSCIKCNIQTTRYDLYKFCRFFGPKIVITTYEPKYLHPRNIHKLKPKCSSFDKLRHLEWQSWHCWNLPTVPPRSYYT
jgi:hypothetical protein